MTNRKTTRRALVLSLLSLLLCCSMLVGTTFAWFTDAVTSGNNKIIAGNLDVELYWSTDCATWTKVDANTNIFDEGYWEPGHTEVVYLKVANEGTLSLKYQLGVNVASETGSTNVLGNAFKLSDYIQYGVVEADEKIGDRKDAVDAVKNATALAAPYSSDVITLAPKGQTGDAETVALVVYMPETVGNEANHRGAEPTILLGLNVYATQVEAENDSFGTDYDTGAFLQTVYTAEELASAIASGESVKLGADITVEETLNVAAGETITLDLNGKTLSSGASLVENAEPVIFNRGVLKLVGGTVSAVDTAAIRNHSSSAKLVMENMNITQSGAVAPEWQGTAVFTSGGATTVIESGTYAGVSSAAIVATSGGHLIINGGTFTADVTTIRVDTWSYNSFLTVNGGEFNVSKAGAKALYADGYKKDININGGTFNAAIDSTYTPININGGTFNQSIKQPGGHQNYYNINGGTFVDDLSVSISGNTKVNGTVTDNGDGTYTVAITPDDVKEMIAAGGNVELVGAVDMGGETVAIPNGTTLSGGTIENARLTVADDSTASFEGVTFGDTVSVEAKGDGALSFEDCIFEINPQKLNGFSRGAAVIGANQYYTLDLTLDGCTFNYQYESGDADLWNAAVFMWSGVKNCTIKNCTFNDYGFVAVKLMNAADNAQILIEGNTFNMSKQGDANWYNNNAVQIMPQHDKAMTVKFLNNTFNGDYEGGKFVATIQVMHGGTLTALTFEQSGNTINGEAVTNDNFDINAQ